MIRAGRLPLLAVALVTVALAAGCTGESPTDEVANGPCPGESGFGVRLAAPGESVDLCMHDDSVMTVFTIDGRYFVTAQMTTIDGTAYEFQMMFPHHPTARSLNLTGNLAQALADQNGAWFYFRDTPDGENGAESVAVTAGVFHLGYSDTKVVAGLFSDVKLDMEAVDDDRVIGSRTILEGFFSILTDDQQGSVTD